MLYKGRGEGMEIAWLFWKNVSQKRARLFKPSPFLFFIKNKKGGKYVV